MMFYGHIIALWAILQVARGAEICCGNLGCFNDNIPFNDMPLPDCASSFNLKYTMYTRSNRNSGQAVSDTVVPSVFSTARRTVFIAHGWNSNGNSAWLSTMKNAFLDREDMNVVIVDWGGGAEVLNYAKAASNTRTTGAYTARVYQNLLAQPGSSTARMWCVGHSLGSHVCGHTGMALPTNSKLGRVTGLDPAGPLFEGNPDKRVGLNPTSAGLVDVIHTDQELGTERDIGHIDFYPTGGNNQPGCFLRDVFSKANFHKFNKDIDLYDSCSHGRAYQFMTESIKSDCFRATRKCTNYNNLPGSCSTCTTCGSTPCALMGYAADNSCSRSGMYYLTVTASAPYCTN
jgi:pimeloyl-ACP methyl ester carboxylesterase